ncbi:MAG: 50S ribosomal protein L25/general stress protein Ctc [Bacteroidales bacterium]|nr:MAG: 50S ribosomal protein L25/general stress protein Ctc [Bacteroidales bacterium]
METFEINGSIRENTGKKDARHLRKDGDVPCVLYGGPEVIHFSAPEKAFKNLIYTPNIFLLKINIDGKNYDALLKDLQFHPVTDRILHIDFIEVSANKPVIVTMPVRLTGDSIGIKNGGKLRWKRRQMKVKGLPKDFPDYLDVDITNLEIGQTIKVGELSYDNLHVLDPARSMVAAVVSSRLVAKGMAAAIEEEVEEEVEAEAEAEVPAETAEGDQEAKPEGEKSAEKEV